MVKPFLELEFCQFIYFFVIGTIAKDTLMQVTVLVSELPEWAQIFPFNHHCETIP